MKIHTWTDLMGKVLRVVEDYVPMGQTTLTDDELYSLVESWSKSTRLRVYKFLNASGCSIAGIDHAIYQALKEEKANG